MTHAAAGLLGQTTLVWGAPQWLAIAAGFFALFILLLALGYRGAGASLGVRMTAALLKAMGIAILALCLLEPLISTRHARPGANAFVLLADDSASMTLKDAAGEQRSTQLKQLASEPSPWLAKLGKDFELRQFAFASQLKAIENVDHLTFDGRASALGGALERLMRRYPAGADAGGKPLAGILLLTDGNATDLDTLERLLAASANDTGGMKLPPIYPLLVGNDRPANDLAIDHVEVTQTNFEDAPVTLTAAITSTGYGGQRATVQLLDEQGKVIETQQLELDKEGSVTSVRFKLKPAAAGLSFYKLRVAADGELGQFDHPQQTAEATLENNTRWAVVDRGKGPFRVLYVAGQPDWTFKFLSRSLVGDDQVQLVGLIRVAKREPKFAFMGAAGEKANPLFQAFGHDPDSVAQFDQPVLERINTADELELRGGFPRSADDLFKYDAIILADVESQFFNQDPLQLFKDFVRQRGGGLLMVGGDQSFHKGDYDKTPVGDVLPVYADLVPNYPAETNFRLSLTREGWLEPWVRLAADEAGERSRLAAMPTFNSLNPVRGIKPGATVLARVTSDEGETAPALVTQRFGRGRSAALLIGDLWRWGTHRTDDKTSDMEKAWRQMVRWLVADVPHRVEITLDPRHDASDPPDAVHLAVQVRDPAYAPLDNATVSLRVTGPDGKPAELRAEPSAGQAGRYEALYVPREPGPYRASAAAAGADGRDIGKATTGWSSNPSAEEFRELQPNAALLQRLAKATGGEVIKGADLDAFVATLPEKHAEIMEPRVEPLWHQSWVFLLALAFLAGEWGLRRWKGLP